MVQNVKGALLVGSVALADRDAVFRTACKCLGSHISRLPDGETGKRDHWISWQFPVFEDNPAIETVPLERGYGSAAKRGYTFRLAEGADPATISFGNIGYADAAIASFGAFDAAQKSGEIPAHIRFQVSLPSPVSPILLWFVIEAQEAVEGPYERAMLAEMRRICDAIPHDRLAIQWDTCVEFGVIEGVFPNRFGERARDELFPRLVKIGDAVPEGVELGYHLCYGDSGGKHFKDPQDTGLLVEMSNYLAENLTRKLDWVHMPVPIDRDDPAYFEALADLTLVEETELYLGLVHLKDGTNGAERRIAAASRYRSDFGVATECGLGRQPSDRISELMDIHAAVARSVV